CRGRSRARWVARSRIARPMPAARRSWSRYRNRRDMRRFYDIDVAHETELLPPIFASIEAWAAYDAGRPCTLVKSRPDIIAAHLSGDEYFSNIPTLEADLVAMSTTPAAPGELALVELRYAED